MTVTDSDVHAEAGPAGLVLACDLVLRGVAVRIIDRHGDRTRVLEAGDLQSRSLELLSNLCVQARVLAAEAALQRT